MSDLLKRNFDCLKVLHSGTTKQRKALLAASPNELIVCIVECIENILNGIVAITPGERQKLIKARDILVTIADKKTSNKKRRQLLVQKGRFLPALLAPIIGIAGSLIGDAIGGLIRK